MPNMFGNRPIPIVSSAQSKDDTMKNVYALNLAEQWNWIYKKNFLQVAVRQECEAKELELVTKSVTQLSSLWALRMPYKQTLNLAEQWN